ncbi:MAG: 30S ribosomal protein S24e [Promethearchaeota archaeon]|jgi:small subunit ribosomal protein S24e
MSFEIEIIEEMKNPLIDRRELTIRVNHFGAGTPNRLDIKKKIAAMEGSDEKLTIVKKLESRYGVSYTQGIIHIYSSPGELQFYEPFHIKVRNFEKDKRTEIYQLKRRKESYKHLFES